MQLRELEKHFLFNSLNTLVALIEQDGPRAVKFVNKLSRVLRYKLNDSESTVDVSKELAVAKTYCEIQKIRYSDAFKYEIIKVKSVGYVEQFSLLSCLEYIVNTNIISEQHPFHLLINVREVAIKVEYNIQPKVVGESKRSNCTTQFMNDASWSEIVSKANGINRLTIPVEKNA